MATTRVRVVDRRGSRARTDAVVTEEPLEVRLGASGRTVPVAVTMRTPGADFELAAGLLYTEGLVGAREVRAIRYCLDPGIDAAQRFNVVTVESSAPLPEDLDRHGRRVLATSACGLCGKATLDAVALRAPSLPREGPVVEVATLLALPERLRACQRDFDATGGLHAAGLFGPDGRLHCLREDVGRHNAVDKVVGWALLARALPLFSSLLVVSGRAGYEIVAKAAAAGIPVVAAISAPSSLAVDLARELGMTLVGFLRGERMNVYAGEQRLAGLR
jgi:FdhD protein